MQAIYLPSHFESFLFMCGGDRPLRFRLLLYFRSLR
jgi:hypothetical protein